MSCLLLSPQHVSNLKDHVRTNGIAAKTKENAHMVYLPSFSSLHNDATLASEPRGYEVVVHST